jgi:alpha-beta hydrolase superfamily lysophospholipase
MTVTWLGASWIIASKLTQRRTPPFDEPAPAIKWARIETHRFKTKDGQEIGAWHIPGNKTKRTVLILHGNGGSRRNCLRQAEIYHQKGFSVFMISMRAHGDSTGEFNDIGYGARHDVIATLERIEHLHPGEPILIHGISMGSAAAILAAKDLGTRVHGYVFESPFQDLKTAVWNRIENALPPVLDFVAYRGLLTVSFLVLPYLDQIAPLDFISNIPKSVNVLIFCGGNDQMARPYEARALYERIKDHCELEVFENADHIRMIDVDYERYILALSKFLEKIGMTEKSDHGF